MPRPAAANRGQAVTTIVAALVLLGAAAAIV